MKRYGNLYQKICSMDNLKEAHRNARKGKGWYAEVKEVDAHLEEYLTKLQEMLVNHTYHTSPYEKFIRKENGKEREIFKLPYFPDRICQWAILQVIEPYLLRNMTSTTYSAIPGKGIHAALHDVQEAMRKDVPNCQFCFKLDVRHFYPSINHAILKAKFRKLFKDAELLWLLDEIIDSISTASIEDMRNIWLLDEDIDPETGIPIGNYLSQYCGNFYLSSFDHWLKEKMHVKHAFRYMDDIVIFGSSKEALHKLQKEVKRYFKTELHLTVKRQLANLPDLCSWTGFCRVQIIFELHLTKKKQLQIFQAKDEQYSQENRKRADDAIFGMVFHQFLQGLVKAL